MTSSSSLKFNSSTLGSVGLGIALLCWCYSTTSSTSCFIYFLLGALLLLYGLFPLLRQLVHTLRHVSRISLVSLSSASDLSPTEFRPFKLIKKTQVSHNAAIYRFGLRPSHSLGLPLGQHVSVKMMVGDKEYQRSYTPITLSTQLDYFELLVKTYAQGHVSKQLDQLSLGTLVYFKGPKGQFKYTPNTYTVLNMIAGGTGITPMYQLIQTILLTLPHDTTQLHLIYANVSLEDILLKKELDELASTYAHQFKVFYVLNQPPENWVGGTGYVTKEMIQTHLAPPSSPGVKLLLCGPPPMMKAMTVSAEEIGYEKAQTISKMSDQIFKF